MFRRLSKIWSQKNWPVVKLDPDNEGASGTYSTAKVFNGASSSMTVCRLNSSDLQENTCYEFQGGLLIIEGSIHCNANIQAEDAKLCVLGDVSHKAQLSAKVPEREAHDDVYAAIMGTSYGCCASFTISVFLGYRYPDDMDAGLIITGHVDPSCRLKSNNGFHVGSVDQNDKATAPENLSALFTHAHQYNTQARSAITTGPAQKLFIAPEIKRKNSVHGML